MLKANLFVITGGPGSGKTSLLLELERRGFPHLPEVAREIIREQVACDGPALPWKDRASYTALMLSRSVASYLEHLAVSDTMFVDRGIPDTLGYARIIGLPDTREIETACAQYRYNQRVFIAPPWEEIYITDSERKQSWEEAVQVFGQLMETYGSCGYKLLELPRCSVEERAAFVMENLSRADSR
jgi:predicted ATPase